MATKKAKAIAFTPVEQQAFNTIRELDALDANRNLRSIATLSDEIKKAVDEGTIQINMRHKIVAEAAKHATNHADFLGYLQEIPETTTSGGKKYAFKEIEDAGSKLFISSASSVPVVFKYNMGEKTLFRYLDLKGKKPPTVGQRDALMEKWQKVWNHMDCNTGAYVNRFENGAAAAAVFENVAEGPAVSWGIYFLRCIALNYLIQASVRTETTNKRKHTLEVKESKKRVKKASERQVREVAKPTARVVHALLKFNANDQKISDALQRARL